jgi:WD40 repeat protein
MWRYGSRVCVLILVVAILPARFLLRHALQGCALTKTGSSETSIVQDDMHYIVAIADQKLLVTAARDGKCKVWDQNTQKMVQSFSFGTAITGLDVSSDGKLLVAGTDGTTIVDTTTWIKRELNKSGIGHRFVGMPPKLAIVDKENALHILDPNGSGVSKVFKQDNTSLVNAVAPAKNGHFVALGFADGTIRVLNTETGEKLFNVREDKRRIRRVL